MFDKFCEKYLPKYFRLGWYCLAIWSAPVRYVGTDKLAARNDTAWEALRITIRKDSNPIFVIKAGVI